MSFLKRTLATAKSRAKSVLLTYAPTSLLITLNKRHQLNVVLSQTAEDEEDLLFLPALVSAGDLVLDIGANYGIYTKKLSELVGTKGKVLSFEPVPPTYEVLCYIVDRLALPNVELKQLAISNENSEVQMSVPQSPYGGGNFYRSQIRPLDSEQVYSSFTVQCRTLDHLLNELNNEPSFIKVDVEGVELDLLKGSTELLKRFKPAWLIEISSSRDSSGRDVFGIMRENAYVAYVARNKKLVKRQEEDSDVNVFFLQEKHLGGLKQQSFLGDS